MVTPIKEREGVFAGRTFRKADRDEARNRHQCACQHRERGRGIGKRCRLGLFGTRLKLGHHRFDGDHRVVDEEAQRNNKRAKRDALQVNSGELHADKHRSEHQRNRARNHGASANAEADEAYGEHDTDRFPQRLQEIVNRGPDDFRLIGGEMRFNADRQIRLDLGHRLFDVLSERQHVSAGPHCDADSDRGLAVKAQHRLRRIGIGAFDGRDIGQPEDLSVGDEIDVSEIGF